VGVMHGLLFLLPVTQTRTVSTMKHASHVQSCSQLN